MDCLWNSLSQMPGAQPCAEEQDRSSPALALHLMQPYRYPRRYLPFSYLTREAGQVVGR